MSSVGKLHARVRLGWKSKPFDFPPVSFPRREPRQRIAVTFRSFVRSNRLKKIYGVISIGSRRLKTLSRKMRIAICKMEKERRRMTWTQRISWAMRTKCTRSRGRQKRKRTWIELIEDWEGVAEGPSSLKLSIGWLSCSYFLTLACSRQNIMDSLSGSTSFRVRG